MIGLIALALLTGSAPLAPSPATLAVGAEHACALREGRVHCWGRNGCGQLGDGGQRDRWTPAAVPWLRDIAHVFAEGDRSCAVDRSGAAWCWGALPADGGGIDEVADDFVAEVLGAPPSAPSTRCKPAPVPVPAAVVRPPLAALRSTVVAPPPNPRDRRERPEGADALSALLVGEPGVWTARPDEICAHAPGALHCWRYDARAPGGWRGALWGWLSPDPYPLDDLEDSPDHWHHRRVDWPAVELIAGRASSCGRDAAGEVWCHRSRADDYRAEPVTAEVEARAVAVGAGFTCAILTDDSARCWGRGFGPPPGRLLGWGAATIGVVGAWEAAAVAGADGAPLASRLPAPLQTIVGGPLGLTADGRLLRLGDGHDAFDVPLERPVVQLTAGFRERCALDDRGGVRCKVDREAEPLLESAGPCLVAAEGSAHCPGPRRPLTGRRAIALAEVAPCGATGEYDFDADYHARTLYALDHRGRVSRHCTITGSAYVAPPAPRPQIIGQRPEDRDGDGPYDGRTGWYHEVRSERVPSLGRAVGLAGAAQVLCLLRADGTLDCHGAFLDDAVVPMRTLRRQTVVRRRAPLGLRIDTRGGLAVGPSHVCGLGADGRIRCAGWNLHGQLGAPPRMDDVWRVALPGAPMRPPPPPSRLDGPDRVGAALAALARGWIFTVEDVGAATASTLRAACLFADDGSLALLRTLAHALITCAPTPRSR